MNKYYKVYLDAITDKEFLKECKREFKEEYIEPNVQIPTKTVDDEIFVAVTSSTYIGYLIGKGIYDGRYNS